MSSHIKPTIYDSHNPITPEETPVCGYKLNCIQVIKAKNKKTFERDKNN